jgi:hypothetical protein
MSITVTGLIERDARYYRGMGDHAIVAIEVHAAIGHPFEVQVRFGVRAEDHARAERAARRVRRGSTAVVTGDSLGHRLDHATAAYQLGRLTHCAIDGDEPIDMLATAGIRQ